MLGSTIRGLRTARAIAFLALIQGATGCLLLPEEGLSGEVVDNVRPTVRITAGVVADSLPAESRVRFFWFGADADGVVRRFEWAIDDTLTEQAWTPTRDFEATISFPATDPADDRRATGWHTFFVRAVDNEGARSRSDRRYFNASTIAPSSRIVSPPPTEGANWASTLRIGWQAEDADGSRPDHLPRWIEYKLVRFSSTPDPGNQPAMERAFRDSLNVLNGNLNSADYPPDSLGDYRRQAACAWTREDGVAVTSAWLRGLDVGRTYGFAVRAIDEAGAVEPEFARGRNWVLFRVSNTRIRVTLCESSLGCLDFNNATFARVWKVTVAPDQPIRFRWEGDARATGSEAGPSNYGFDIPDPADDGYRDANGIGGWIGWGNWSQTRQSISFPRSEEGKVHYFYLRMRDVTNLEETETDCMVEIRVSRLSFNRKFLIVDDLFYAPKPCQGSPPTDAATDEHRLRLLGDGIEQFRPAGERLRTFATFGPEQFGNPAELPDDFLDTLGTYQNVIWDCGSAQPVGYITAVARGLLGRYVGAGGNLMLWCDRGPASLVSPCPVSAEVPCCPCEGTCAGRLWVQRSGFLWDLLGLRGCTDKPRSSIGSERDMVPLTLLRAVAAHDLYPDLTLDPQRWVCGSLARGVTQFEGLVPNEDEPAGDPWYGREVEAGMMDILYRSRAFDPTCRTDGLPIAWRTPGARGAEAEAGARGRVVTFSFHPYFFREAGARSAMTLALRWLVTGQE